MVVSIASKVGNDVKRLQHIPSYGGEIWFVNGIDGSDGNSGQEPDQAFLTIGKAILTMSSGDAINISAGMYTELNLDLNCNSCEMWFEIGAVITPASGTALTISGNYCKLKGEHLIIPAALAIGLKVPGSNCSVSNTKVIGGAIGFQVTGAGLYAVDVAAGQQTSIAYDLQGIQGRIRHGATVGIGNTIGYKISNGADTGVLENCTSTGHATSGFYIDTGSANWTLKNCSSGGGDGKWIDVDNSNVWSNFTYAGEVHAHSVFVPGVTEFNLFKVIGGVRIVDIQGHVETVIPGVASVMYLQLYSVGGTVDITDAPGVQISGAVVGGLFVRNEDSTNKLDKADPNGTPAAAESTNFRDPKTSMDLVKDNTNDTYVRVVLSVAQASGEIHWHCHWEPLTEDGILIPV